MRKEKQNRWVSSQQWDPTTIITTTEGPWARQPKALPLRWCCTDSQLLQDLVEVNYVNTKGKVLRNNIPNGTNEETSFRPVRHHNARIISTATSRHVFAFWWTQLAKIKVLSHEMLIFTPLALPNAWFRWFRATQPQTEGNSQMKRALIKAWRTLSRSLIECCKVSA